MGVPKGHDDRRQRQCRSQRQVEVVAITPCVLFAFCRSRPRQGLVRLSPFLYRSLYNYIYVYIYLVCKLHLVQTAANTKCRRFDEVQANTHAEICKLARHGRHTLHVGRAPRGPPSVPAKNRLQPFCNIKKHSVLRQVGAGHTNVSTSAIIID